MWYKSFVIFLILILTLIVFGFGILYFNFRVEGQALVNGPGAFWLALSLCFAVLVIADYRAATKYGLDTNVYKFKTEEERLLQKLIFKKLCPNDDAGLEIDKFFDEIEKRRKPED